MEESPEEIGQGNDEEQPLMDENNNHPPEEAEPQLIRERRDNSRDPKFMFCFSYKCGVNFTGALIIVTLIYGCLHAYFIDFNMYFDDVYYYIFILFLLPYFISVVFFMMYWCSNDNHWSR